MRPLPSAPLPTLEEYGLHLTQTIFEAGEAAAQASSAGIRSARLHEYADNRDNTADENSTSALSVHLKYGTLSVRDCWREAETMGGRGARKWQDELAWRDFFNTLLWHHPYMLTESHPARAGRHAFRPERRVFGPLEDRHDRVSLCGRGHPADARDGLDAQPDPSDRGVVFVQRLTA